MIKNTIHPLTRQEFVKMVRDDLYIQHPPYRFARLWLDFGREWVLAREKGETDWLHWVEFGYRGAQNGRLMDIKKALGELTRLADADDR